jgi:hypothetical protein
MQTAMQPASPLPSISRRSSNSVRRNGFRECAQTSEPKNASARNGQKLSFDRIDGTDRMGNGKAKVFIL